MNTIICADALEWLCTLPDASVNCIVTSPPYFGLRDYGVVGQIGLELTLRDYIDRIEAVFSEARRVLRDDGVCWVNMGDSYSGSWGNYAPGGIKSVQRERTPGGRRWERKAYQNTTMRPPTSRVDIPEKNLLGVPWRLAFALQDSGWILRSDCIWHKPNPMPESVRDRPTKAHEYVFLLSKTGRYWYDSYAEQEAIAKGNGGKNLRTVWTLSTEPNKFAHFAAFPRSLVGRCIAVGCPMVVCNVCGKPWIRIVQRVPSPDPEGYNGSSFSKGKTVSPRDALSKVGRGERYEHLSANSFVPVCACNAGTRPGTVIDPFIGIGTTALVARGMLRNYMGCDINQEYVDIANARLNHD